MSRSARHGRGARDRKCARHARDQHVRNNGTSVARRFARDESLGGLRGPARPASVRRSGSSDSPGGNPTGIGGSSVRTGRRRVQRRWTAGTTGSGGSGGAPLPPETELESSYEVPVATGQFIWVANPQSGRVAYVDARRWRCTRSRRATRPPTWPRSPAQRRRGDRAQRAVGRRDRAARGRAAGSRRRDDPRRRRTARTR